MEGKDLDRRPGGGIKVTGVKVIRWSGRGRFRTLGVPSTHDASEYISRTSLGWGGLLSFIHYSTVIHLLPHALHFIPSAGLSPFRSNS